LLQRQRISTIADRKSTANEGLQQQSKRLAMILVVECVGVADVASAVWHTCANRNTKEQALQDSGVELWKTELK
jgi:hypothetical protein